MRIGEEQDGAGALDGVAQAEFVEHIGVGRGEVGHRVVAEDKPFEHRFVDDPAGLLLVGAEWIQAGLANGGRDQFLIDSIKLNRCALGPGFGPKGHEHKAKWVHGAQNMEGHRNLVVVLAPMSGG